MEQSNYGGQEEKAFRLGSMVVIVGLLGSFFITFFLLAEREGSI